MGYGDIKYRDAGTIMINAKVGGKCDISFFVKMCFLMSTFNSIIQKAHWTHQDVFTKYFVIRAKHCYHAFTVMFATKNVYSKIKYSYNS